MQTATLWEYQVVEEPNPVALQERLTRIGREGWEAMSLGYAGKRRLLALLRRAAPSSGTFLSREEDESDHNAVRGS